MLSYKFCCVLISLAATVKTQSTGYYWRPHNGEIPSDAFVANADIPNAPNAIYVGRAPCDTVGLYVGEIVSGNENISVLIPDYTGMWPGKVCTVNSRISILCSADGTFSWRAATSANVNSIPGVVKAGYETVKLGDLLVGRAFANLGQEIGKVVAYHNGDGKEGKNILYIPIDGKEEEFEGFEVLTYTPA